MFAEEALDQGLQIFAGLGKDEAVRGFGPVQLEAGGLSGDPDLADGRIWGENELSRSILEEYVENAILLLCFEAPGLFGDDEGLLQGRECGICLAAEGDFVEKGHVCIFYGRLIEVHVPEVPADVLDGVYGLRK